MSDVKKVVEASLFMAGRPVRYSEIAEVSDHSKEDIREAAKALAGDYGSRDSAVEIVYDKTKAIMNLNPDIEDEVMFLAPATEMSQALLKTLAVIAHDEPVSQSQLVKSRGTRVYYYVKKLYDMELISARKKGRTKMLSTTPKFKAYFKIDKVPKKAEDKNVESA